MPTEQSGLIEEISWDYARKKAALGNPELTHMIDDLSPGKDLSLIQVRYPFGSIIAEDDVLYLPVSRSKTSPLQSAAFPKKWQEKLGYQSLPFGMITENTLEVYKEFEEKVFSVALSTPNSGIEIGISEMFGSTPAYTLSSGARSLYMLPRISQASLHKKLRREYGISSPPPKNLLDHWHIFRELSMSPSFKTSWDCEILFFTHKWNQYLNKDDKAWLKLKNYLYRKGIEHSMIGKRKVVFDIVWEQASSLLMSKRMKPDPYIVDTLKHLLMIAVGGLPGMRPSIGNNLAGPLREIQKIYAEIYGLSEQIPTIMHPYNFSILENKPVYYSLQTPMLLSSTPNFRSMSSNIEDMRELMNMKKYVLHQDYGNLKIDHALVSTRISEVQFEYFHGEMYAYGADIRPTKEMPRTDPDLSYMPTAPGKRNFADNGAYIRGCIKISKKT